MALETPQQHGYGVHRDDAASAPRHRQGEAAGAGADVTYDAAVDVERVDDGRMDLLARDELLVSIRRVPVQEWPEERVQHAPAGFVDRVRCALRCVCDAESLRCPVVERRGDTGGERCVRSLQCSAEIIGFDATVTRVEEDMQRLVIEIREVADAE